jgi:hypothetical protein
MTKITAQSPGQHTEFENIQKRMAEIRREKKRYQFDRSVRLVHDTATYIRKQLRQDLVVKYLARKGIE